MLLLCEQAKSSLNEISLLIDCSLSLSLSLSLLLKKTKESVSRLQYSSNFICNLLLTQKPVSHGNLLWLVI